MPEDTNIQSPETIEESHPRYAPMLVVIFVVIALILAIFLQSRRNTETPVVTQQPTTFSDEQKAELANELNAAAKESPELTEAQNNRRELDFFIIQQQEQFEASSQ